jgi:hypothetical protein
VTTGTVRRWKIKWSTSQSQEQKMSEEKKMVVIPLSVINEVLTVLSARPFSEVADIISRVQSSSQLINRDEQDAAE